MKMWSYFKNVTVAAVVSALVILFLLWLILSFVGPGEKNMAIGIMVMILLPTVIFSVIAGFFSALFSAIIIFSIDPKNKIEQSNSFGRASGVIMVIVLTVGLPVIQASMPWVNVMGDWGLSTVLGLMLVSLLIGLGICLSIAIIHKVLSFAISPR